MAIDAAVDVGAIPDAKPGSDTFQASVDAWAVVLGHRITATRALNAYERALKQAREKEQ